MRAETRTFPDRGALAEAAAREVIRLAVEAIRDHGRFSIALAGGSTPRETYERLAAMGVPTAADAPRWDVFFGDERMVPRDHADSNGGMASRAWLSRSGIPAERLHFVATERGDATTAAAAYEDELRSTFARRGDEVTAAGSPPRLDLVLLGLGDDGHTASLFPGSPALREAVRWAVAARGPKPPTERVTLTLPVLCAARHVRFLVAGAEKADVLRSLLSSNEAAGLSSPDAMPAALVVGPDVVVFCDAAAGSPAARATMRGMDSASSSSAAHSNAAHPSAADEASLVEALRRGDDGAYERLVRETGPRLLAVIRRLVANEDDARDVLQETFVSAWKAIGQFEGGARLSTWLHRIAVNAALMRLRSRKARPERPIDDLMPRFSEEGHFAEPPARWEPRADTALEGAETRDRVRAAIDRLPETHRTVLVLRDVEGLSTEDTAQLLGVTPNAVKVRLHRAHLALRTLLDPHFRPDSKTNGRASSTPSRGPTP